jgi:hypothetical protein
MVARDYIFIRNFVAVMDHLLPDNYVLTPRSDITLSCDITEQPINVRLTNLHSYRSSALSDLHQIDEVDLEYR